MQFSFEISPDHPALSGHFPGMPVVPAVVLIERLASHLEKMTGEPIRGIRQLRLLGVVQPGQRVDVDVKEKAPGAWRLTCRVAEKVVVKGSLVGTLSEQPDVLAADDSGADDYRTTEAAYQRLPHGGDMQLVPALALSASGAATELSLGEGHPLANDQGLPAWATLEYAAQLMACRKVFMAGDTMRKAVIVQVRSLHCHGLKTLPFGQDLSVRVIEDVAQAGVVQCLFSALVGEQLVASGEFMVLSEA